ncbi:rhodanese-like domain-containing protein [Bacillus salacetis]|uniref:rhodanese-like domain-containing protein n=1 Tax=Bacillus salacetis TaxID=2315464 RepID=UPI003BA15DAC
MPDYKTITTDELKKMLDEGANLELVDVREDEEVAEGMIPQAKHIKMGDIPESLDKFEKEKEYILICRSGNRSGKVSQFMHDRGYKVVNMEGGMLEWEGETQPKDQCI